LLKIINLIKETLLINLLVLEIFFFRILFLIRFVLSKLLFQRYFIKWIVKTLSIFFSWHIILNMRIFTFWSWFASIKNSLFLFDLIINSSFFFDAVSLFLQLDNLFSLFSNQSFSLSWLFPLFKALTAFVR
jgi:hypothetical protein